MNPLLRILVSNRDLAPTYGAIMLCSVLVAATALGTPFIIKGATEVLVAASQGDDSGYFGAGVVRTVIVLAVGLLVMELANATLTNIGGFFGDHMAARMRASLSNRFYAKLLGLPQRYFDNNTTGTIISKLNRNIVGVTDFLQSVANNFLSMLLTIAAVLVTCAIYYWPLAVLLGALFPTYAWLTTRTSKKWLVWEQRKNDLIDTASGRFAEVVGHISVVKSFVRERTELFHFAGRFNSTISLTRKQSRYWHAMDSVRRTILSVIFFGLYVLLFVRTAQGGFTIDQMVFLLQLIAMAKTPVFMMSWLVDIGQRAIAGSTSYFEVLDETGDENRFVAPTATLEECDRLAAEHRDIDVSSVRAPGPGIPVIEFDKVSFRYNDEDGDVIKGVSFVVEHGHKVALVSESGGGKSTLVSLLLGLYKPSSGTVRLLGQDISTLTLAQRRSLVSVVFQDAALFSGTVRENITYGRPDMSDADMVDVATRAHADAFVSRFASGYDTVVGERGLKLSGGQKQRIAIARAMGKDAPVLVLDEATSALDTRSERLVQRGLDAAMTGRTSLIIAHRLSTISSVDTIVTLQRGAIDEVGSPAELARSGGIYSELLSLQASTSTADRKRLAAYGIVEDNPT